jgi:hypothetical protein
MGYVARCHVPSRPHTLGFIDIQRTAPELSASDKVAQQWIADIDQYEIILEEMAAATLDQDYKNEITTCETWFRVLSDAERAVSLYAFVHQMTPEQIGFFLQVLKQMAKKH